MSDDVNPYRSPETPAEPILEVVGPAGKPAIPYASGHTRAIWTMSLLAAGMVADLLATGSSLLQIGLLGRIQAGEMITEAEIVFNDTRQGLIGFGQTGIYLAASIAFLMWFHRAHRNLPALRAGVLEYSPGWAVGAFFVPILNLFRPYQIMREVWAGSDPEQVDSGVGAPLYDSVPALLGWWWALWLLMNVAGQISFRMSMHAETPGLLIAASWATVCADLISIPAALLAIQVVRGVDANQERRYQLLARAAQPA